jgi:hypothetical protein
MAVSFDSPFAFRMWTARRWARGARDPGACRSRLDELQRLADDNGESAERLVDLLLDYKRAETESMQRQVQAFLASPQSVVAAAAAEEVPGPLRSEMVLLAHCALVELGPPARDVLVQRYRQAPSGSLERKWMLRTLAAMGDPNLDPLLLI